MWRIENCGLPVAIEVRNVRIMERCDESASRESAVAVMAVTPSDENLSINLTPGTTNLLRLMPISSAATQLTAGQYCLYIEYFSLERFRSVYLSFSVVGLTEPEERALLAAINQALVVPCRRLLVRSGLLLANFGSESAVRDALSIPAGGFDEWTMLARVIADRPDALHGLGRALSGADDIRALALAVAILEAVPLTDSTSSLRRAAATHLRNAVVRGRVLPERVMEALRHVEWSERLARNLIARIEHESDGEYIAIMASLLECAGSVLSRQVRTDAASMLRRAERRLMPQTLRARIREAVDTLTSHSRTPFSAVARCEFEFIDRGVGVMDDAMCLDIEARTLRGMPRLGGNNLPSSIVVGALRQQ